MPYERYVSLYLHVNGKDHLTKVTHKLGTGAAVTLAEYTYDALGRQSTKKQGTNTSTYSYNIRSWLTGISSGKFTQTLGYGSHYNGNISSMNWNSNGTSHAYTFTYDGVNRMLNATHGTGAYTEKVTSYDKNGNIKALQRYGNGLIDNLTYTYSGNQLTRVDDATGNTNGFSNGASAANEYVYDNNGNLTKDSNKGITNIAYNSLNLPSTVTFSDGSTIVYTYAADGTKLRTVHTISVTTTQKDYCANVVYENGVQKMLLTEEGYVDLSASTPAYYYYLKDHQGNNRVVINSSGTVQETNHYYPFGSLFASTSVQPYKYNGKELDTKKGLNWYDYGARHYDATLGRWLAVDPLAEKYYSTSTYGYCLNNPMKYVDPNGKVVSPYFDYDGNFLGVDEEGFAGQIKITTSIQFASMRSTGNFNTNAYLNLQDLALSAEAMSKIYTKVLDEQGYDIGLLEGNAVSVVGDLGDTFNNPSPNVRYASTRGSLGKGTFTISVNNSEKSVREELNTVENIQSGLGDHEFVGHGVNKLGDYNKTHSKVYEYQMKQPVYEKTTDKFKIHMSKNAALYNGK